MIKVNELIVDSKHGVDVFVSEDELKHYYIPYYSRVPYGTTNYYVRQCNRVEFCREEDALRFIERGY